MALINNYSKATRQRAIIVLSIFVLFLAIYFLPIWKYISKNIIKYNEDIDRNTAQIIESRGFKAEDHYIVTGDNYILKVTRIVNPYVKDKNSLKPILLHHGFQCNANGWVINTEGRLTEEGKYVEDKTEGPVGNTLGFVLAVNGFDVWLANMRGTADSTNHTKLSPEDPEFWKFSIDEMVEYDLPAMISYIQKETKKTQLAYIGHSQGTYEMFALLATRPEYSNVVKPFIALSPVPYLTHTSSPLFHLGQYLYSIVRRSETPFFSFGRFQQAYSQLCDSNFIARHICYRIFYFILGMDRDQCDFDRLAVYMANVPTGSSSWNAAHLLQTTMQGGPKKFDYGPEMNMQKYNSSQPPDYDMSAINSTHIALIYTANDWLNDLKDVQTLKDKLKVKLLDDYLVPDPKWNHMELQWAKDAGKLVNSRILEILAKTSN